ncbi:MAG TPA: glutamate carboxypeptidase [Caulobacteraceae bacterium]
MINRWLTGVCALAFCASAGAAFAAGKPPAPDKKVWDAAQAARADQLKLLEQVVDIDSGTGDADGGRKVEAVLIPILKSLGATVETVPAEAPGLPENVVATFTGTGKGRILMIGHIDTVFGPGTVAQRPYRVEGDHARGPGVSDEKGGVVEGVYALKILHDLGFKDYAKITFLMETSEERGSPGTQGLIKKLLTDADVEFNLEPGDPPDALTVWRKGSATFHIDVKGRAAHAGIAPQDGRNAIQELIHQIKGLDVFPTSGPGTTVNVDVISGGTRNNIIPDVARAEVNVRVRDQAIFDQVEAVMRKDAETHVIPDTTVTVSREGAFPPLANNPGTDALAARAAAIYAPLGRKLENGGNGGASESALASAQGVPALDGLGPVGGGFHSDQEYLDLTTVTPRLYLLTKMVMDLGAHPPVKK